MYQGNIRAPRCVFCCVFPFCRALCVAFCCGGILTAHSRGSCGPSKMGSGRGVMCLLIFGFGSVTGDRRLIGKPHRLPVVNFVILSRFLLQRSTHDRHVFKKSIDS